MGSARAPGVVARLVLEVVDQPPHRAVHDAVVREHSRPDARRRRNGQFLAGGAERRGVGVDVGPVLLVRREQMRVPHQRRAAHLPRRAAGIIEHKAPSGPVHGRLAALAIFVELLCSADARRVHEAVRLHAVVRAEQRGQRAVDGGPVEDGL